MCGCLSRHFPSFSGWFLFYSFRGLRRFPLPLLFPESLLFTTLSFCLTFVFPLFLIILVTSALKRSRENTLVLPQLLKPHSYDVSSPRSHSLTFSLSLPLSHGFPTAQIFTLAHTLYPVVPAALLPPGDSSSSLLHQTEGNIHSTQGGKFKMASGSRRRTVPSSRKFISEPRQAPRRTLYNLGRQGCQPNAYAPH